MSKLPKRHRFLDLSDYGRPVAKFIANSLKNTVFTPVHVTFSFMIVGLLGVYCILNQQFLLAAILLVFKSILDAADGELARIRNKPSYVGRYLDSIFDIILNFILLLAIAKITNYSFLYMFLAFIGIQLQGTLFNYYYVILRNKFSGDTTSQIFETKTPTAMHGESQRKVNILFKIYLLLYGVFDRVIYFLDTDAANSKLIPNWLMTAVSTFGLGFQLLLIGLLLVFGFGHYVIPFFIGYSFFIFVFIIIRRSLNKFNAIPKHTK